MLSFPHLPFVRVLTLAISIALVAVSARADDDRAPAQAAPEKGVTEQRLLDHIRALPVKRAAWGDAEHNAGLRKTEQLIIDQLKAYGYEPLLHPVDYLGSRVNDNEDAKGKPYNNIIVELLGTTTPTEVLILGAHFDAVPRSPGADDNGTGTAALLEAARVLKSVPMQRTVRLIFFNLEEPGLVGSRAYAQSIKPDLDAGKYSIVGMISMDMLGYYSDAPNSQQSPIPPSKFFKAPTVADFIGIAGILRHRMFSQALDKAMKQAEPEVKTVVVDFLPIAPPDLLRSDHAPFLALGAPAVIMSDTANFRSAHYHKPTDTIDTLDAKRFTITARAVIGAIHRLAGPPGEPLIPLVPPKQLQPAESDTQPAPKPADPAPAPANP